MLSAEVLRQSCEPMTMNAALGAREADQNSPFGSYLSSASSNNSSYGGMGGNGGGLFGGRGNSSASVPLNEPVFVNTTLTASQRLDLYRQLVYPPCDGVPTLQLSR
ncbi:unnamed protein product, partial [Mesorhabditis spiculigera]